MFPVAGQATACHVTPVFASPVVIPWPRPSATAAAVLRSMCCVVLQVAHASTIVATIDLPIQVMLTHMPQYRPCPKLPVGNAAKYGDVAVFGTVSVMPAGQVPLTLPDCVPQ